MTDQPTDHPRTIDQAATELGISREAVRLRLRRGTLRGERQAGQWVVWLVGGHDQATDHGDQPTDRPASTTTRSRRVRDDRDHLLEEIAYLRGALEREQIAHGEARRLMGNMQQQLGIVQEQLGGLLAAPQTEPASEQSLQDRATSPTMDATPAEGEPSSAIGSARGWWRFWRRP